MNPKPGLQADDSFVIDGDDLKNLYAGMRQARPRIHTYIVRHEGEDWVVRTRDGKKVLGRHKTKADADAQLRAIEANK